MFASWCVTCSFLVGSASDELSDFRNAANVHSPTSTSTANSRSAGCCLIGGVTPVMTHSSTMFIYIYIYIVHMMCGVMNFTCMLYYTQEKMYVCVLYALNGVYKSQLCTVQCTCSVCVNELTQLCHNNSNTMYV